MQTQSKKSGTLQLIPIFFCFAVMGFIDIVGVSVSHVKQDFGLSDKVANLLPSMTLIWFLLISIPTATLMRRIGRKSTVLTSLVIMAVAMVLPLVHYGFAAVFAGYWICASQVLLYVLIAVIGLAGANVFAIALSLAMKYRPESSDSISALMIMGITGGAILPPVMGFVSDLAGFKAGFAVPMAAIAIVLWAAFWLSRKEVR